MPERRLLRRDIRDLGDLLGRTLVRQEGEELLDLVERVRLAVRDDRAAAATWPAPSSSTVNGIADALRNTG